MVQEHGGGHHSIGVVAVEWSYWVLLLPGDQDHLVANLHLNCTLLYRYDDPYKKWDLTSAYPRQHS